MRLAALLLLLSGGMTFSGVAYADEVTRSTRTVRANSPRTRPQPRARNPRSRVLRTLIANARSTRSTTGQQQTDAFVRALDVSERAEALFQNDSGFGNCPSPALHAAISGARRGFEARIHVIGGRRGENAHAFTSLKDNETGEVLYVSWGRVFNEVADVAEYAGIPRDAYVTASFIPAAYIAKRIQLRANFPAPAALTELEYNTNLITNRLFRTR